MALSKKDEVLIAKYLEKFRTSGYPEQNHYQCPLVQEVFKDKKPALVGKVLVLGDFRLFIFDKSGQGSSGIKDGLVKAASLIKKKDNAVPSAQVEEIAYLDILSIEHNKTSKFTIKVRSWVKGPEKPVTYAFRTDSMPTIVEKVCHLRQRMCGAFPGLSLVGPPMPFQEQLRPFRYERPTSHYINIYPSWCNYYNAMKPNPMLGAWVKYCEDVNRYDLDINDAPGFSVKSDDTFNIGPLIMSLVHDSYFRGLVVHDVTRRETIYELAEVVRHNTTLTKLVAVNVDGDTAGFLALGAAMNGNTNDNLQILDFADNRIGIGTDGLVATFARYRNRITYLNLNNCQIPGAKLVEIFAAFSQNEQLTRGLEYLDLSNNRFDEDASTALGQWGLKHAEKMELRQLHLAGTGFNFNSIVKLKMLPKLHTLNISHNKIDTELHLQCLWHFFDINTSVVHLNLSHTGFGQQPLAEKTVEFLQFVWSKQNQLPQIELNISFSVLSDFTPSALVGGKNLTRIDLSGLKLKESAFTDVIQVLAGLPKLYAVNFEDVLANRNASPEMGVNVSTMLRSSKVAELVISNGFGKQACVAFLRDLRGNNKHLLSLDMSHNMFGDTGAEALASFLLDDSVLHSLRFEGNQVRHNGYSAIFVALHYNKTLRHIYWSSQDIEEAGRELPRVAKDQFYKRVTGCQARLLAADPNGPTGTPSACSGFKHFNDPFGSHIPPTPGAGTGDLKRKDTLTAARFQLVQPSLRGSKGSSGSKRRDDEESSSITEEQQPLSPGRPQVRSPVTATRQAAAAESGRRTSWAIAKRDSPRDLSMMLPATPPPSSSSPVPQLSQSPSTSSSNLAAHVSQEKGVNANPSTPGSSGTSKDVIIPSSGDAHRQHSNSPQSNPSPLSSSTTPLSHSKYRQEDESAKGYVGGDDIAQSTQDSGPDTARPIQPAGSAHDVQHQYTQGDDDGDEYDTAYDEHDLDDSLPPYINPFLLSSLKLPNEDAFL